MSRSQRVHLIKRHPGGENYNAICLFGIIFSVRPLNAQEVNHELIHAEQQKELLYIPFFIWYVLEWLALLIKYRDRMQAYRHIRFEEEAYNHQADLCYLKNRKRYRYK